MAIRTIGGDEFHRRVRLGPRERDAVVTELFRLHYAELVSRLVYKGVPRHVAEERTAEIFMGLMRNCEKLSAATPPIHYLNRAVSNAICDYHAREGRRNPPDGDPPPGADDPANVQIPNPAPGPDRPATNAPILSSLDDQSAPEIADSNPMTSPDYELERRQNCAVQAWQQFEEENAHASEVLSAYALDEMDMEEARVAMKAKSPQAARQRMYTWRARLKELCRKWCGNDSCSTGATQGGSHGE